MAVNGSDSLYRTLAKAILFAACMVVLLWFLFRASGVVLLFLFALVLAIVINSPVSSLEQKGIRRVWGSALVFGIILLAIGLLSWLIIPIVSDQITTLLDNLPSYAESLSKNIASWFEDYPQISRDIKEKGVNISHWFPSIPNTLMQIGNYSLSIIGSIIVGILFINLVVYAVTNPRPLMEIYFSFFPIHKREKATLAFQHASLMIRGWIRANLIGGGITSVATVIFLSILGVPGAWVWGALAFFSELIPRIGFYIASVPPILVALSISPMTAVWVTIFMIAMDEIMADVVMPRIRANTMKIHPVSILFVFLAMGAAFGFMGAILATPVTAIIKAYYEAFYNQSLEGDEELQKRIDAVLYHKKKPPER